MLSGKYLLQNSLCYRFLIQIGLNEKKKHLDTTTRLLHLKACFLIPWMLNGNKEFFFLFLEVECYEQILLFWRNNLNVRAKNSFYFNRWQILPPNTTIQEKVSLSL